MYKQSKIEVAIEVIEWVSSFMPLGETVIKPICRRCVEK